MDRKRQFNIGPYKVVELIYESKKTRIYKAILDSTATPSTSSSSLPLSSSQSSLGGGEVENRDKEQQDFIVKTVRVDAPTIEELARLRHEFTILKDLYIEGVVEAVGLESYGNGLALILRDFEGKIRSISLSPPHKSTLYENIKLQILGQTYLLYY